MSPLHRACGSLLGCGLSLLAFMYAPTGFFIFAGLVVTAIGCWWVARLLITWVFTQ